MQIKLFNNLSAKFHDIWGFIFEFFRKFSSMMTLSRIQFRQYSFHLFSVIKHSNDIQAFVWAQHENRKVKQFMWENHNRVHVYVYIYQCYFELFIWASHIRGGNPSFPHSDLNSCDCKCHSSNMQWLLFTMVEIIGRFVFCSQPLRNLP